MVYVLFFIITKLSTFDPIRKYRFWVYFVNLIGKSNRAHGLVVRSLEKLRQGSRVRSPPKKIKFQGWVIDRKDLSCTLELLSWRVAVT